MRERYALICVPVATLWSSPESPRPIDAPALGDHPDYQKWLGQMTKEQTIALCTDKRIQTQALFGESVRIEEERQGWMRITIPAQPTLKSRAGYPGWLPRAQITERCLCPSIPMRNIIVHQQLAPLKLTTGRLLELSYATFLPLIGRTDDQLTVATPLGMASLRTKDCVLPQQQRPRTGIEIVRDGAQFMNLAYLWGGTSSFGFDCSGFCYAVFRANGYLIPRDAADQYRRGVIIENGAERPGDLLFFAEQEGRGRVHHVGIYAGSQQMLHSPTPGAAVSLTRLPGTDYARELCGIRRYWQPRDSG
ncbi:MAG: C40 family peptidase [Sporolactobacillus sp.]